MTAPDEDEGGALVEAPELPARLDDLVVALTESRAMPISGALIGNRAELLALVDEVRAAVPEELYRAEELLAAARESAERAEAEAARLVEAARTAAAALVEDHAVVAAAHARAAEIVAEARATAADRLAEAEVTLGRLLVGTRAARVRLQADAQTSDTGSLENPLPG